MFAPELFRRNLLDDFFEFPFSMSRTAAGTMKADVRETDHSYELEIDLPGIRKEDVKAELNNGYLTVTASASRNDDEKDAGGSYIRRERFSGAFSRSFYVGEAVREDEISAKFSDGVLKLSVPKKEKQPDVDTRKYIAIES